MKKNIFKKAVEGIRKAAEFVKDHRHEIEYFISEHDEATDTNLNSGINVSAELSDKVECKGDYVEFKPEE